MTLHGSRSPLLKVSFLPPILSLKSGGNLSLDYAVGVFQASGAKPKPPNIFEQIAHSDRRCRETICYPIPNKLHIDSIYLVCHTLFKSNIASIVSHESWQVECHFFLCTSSSQHGTKSFYGRQLRHIPALYKQPHRLHLNFSCSIVTHHKLKFYSKIMIVTR